MKFRKAVLKTGTYHSPDGRVDVTPERLTHWAKQFARMRDAKQVIPIDWDHASSEAELQPLTMDQYAKRRSAKNTVGHLYDFQVASDGQRAELTLEVLDDRAKAKAKDNLVYVSPVIFPAWKDGAGNRYEDVITHVDFVNHPVDHSQGAFEPIADGVINCAIRMGLAKPMRMGDMDKEPEEDEDKAAPEESDDDADIVEEEAEPAAGVQDDDGRLRDVVSALAGMNIILSPDTNTGNLLAHLHNALLTAAAHRGEGPTGDNPAGPGAAPMEVADQGAVALSLAQQKQLDWANNQYRQHVAGRMRALLDTGRCTPAEHNQRRPATEAVKLSLADDGKPVPSAIEQWIESREACPEGTFWEPGSRLKKLSAAVAHPKINTGELAPEEVEQVASWAMGRRTK
jgi:hypothetical protein